ncbi:zinc finger BED domain-containing protein 4-like [Bacillus rossius redtenbacheri]|uniref:zinc finger BED domain-containing protein 4-like n=1 Tax=Bacillus rossius redtenbacheri TaxID=93214 RepID=UPI002FDD9A53
MICVDNQPLSVVENKGFRKLIAFLEPRYSMVSRKFLANTLIPEMYQTTCEKVKGLLVQTEYISLTLDMWTSSAKDDFMGITAHFIDSEYEACHVALEVRPFLEVSHNAENIIHFILELCESWNIEDRIFVIVRDNARNITAALNSSTYQHLPCLAHTLQLVIHDAVLKSASLSNIFSVCRWVVGHYKHSTAATKVLKKAQATLGVKQHRLVQDETTRWNSSLHMIQRLLEQKQAVTLASSQLAGVNEELTSTQWELLKNIAEVLEIFNQATLVLSSSSVTISEVIPIVNSIIKHLEDLNLPGLTGVRNDLLASLKLRFKEMETRKVSELYN